jgi:hypothetical protein
MTAGRWREAQRQQALIDAIDAAGAVDAADADGVARAGLQLREAGSRAARGLEVYRANAQALAERALGAAFASVQTMVGADDFAHLAREFWHARPPQRGDMGEWGDAFPDWLAVHPGLAPWPYLGDCARLDLALHRSERAADAAFDAASLSLLHSGDPRRLMLRLMPGAQLLVSTWPIATIHHAHQVDEPARAQAFDDVRAALAEPRAEQVLVARKGWRALVHRLDAGEAGFTASVLRGASLGAALAGAGAGDEAGDEADADAAGAGFDFARWLGRALRESWLKDVVVSGD